MIKQFESQIKESFKTEDDQKLLSGFIIHTADFAGGAKPFKTSREWSIRVSKEFQAQYEEEGKMGYPQQPYMKNLDQVNTPLRSRSM
jgi:cAMP-specific phosphodiesterase 4